MNDMVGEISIAPMMQWTTRHYRFIMRQITRQTTLYTEMRVDNTVLNAANLEPILGYSQIEHPVVLQLGGNDAASLCKAAVMGEQAGFDAINLNAGCPSDKVSGRCFGAALMKSPALVTELLSEMKRAVQVPVTIKCRLGVDDMDSYEQMLTFVRHVEAAGVKTIIVHARKCWLNGLDTKKNRTVPELKYDWVYRLASEFPDIKFVLNGGVNSLDRAESLLLNPNHGHNDEEEGHLQPEDTQTGSPGRPNRDIVLDNPVPIAGVMIGRAAWQNPCMFADVDRRFYGAKNPNPTRREIVERYIEYTEQLTGYNYYTRILAKPVVTLFNGMTHSNDYRAELHKAVHLDREADFRVAMERAVSKLPDYVLDAPLVRTSEKMPDMESLRVSDE